MTEDGETNEDFMAVFPTKEQRDRFHMFSDLIKMFVQDALNEAIKVCMEVPETRDYVASLAPNQPCISFNVNVGIWTPNESDSGG